MSILGIPLSLIIANNPFTAVVTSVFQKKVKNFSKTP
jgi:hypothetical protein